MGNEDQSILGSNEAVAVLEAVSVVEWFAGNEDRSSQDSIEVLELLLALDEVWFVGTGDQLSPGSIVELP